MTTLAEQQAALLAALSGSAPMPPGFDARRLQATAAALARKRRRGVVQAWPGLAPMLQGDFESLFARYAAKHALPRSGGPLADGRAFVRFLAAQRPLADDVTLQALSVDARYRRGREGLARRRWPWIAFAWLPRANCLALSLCRRDGSERSFLLALPRLRRRGR